MNKLQLFHAVGRIVYAKRAEKTSSSWKEAERLLNNERMRLVLHLLFASHNFHFLGALSQILM